MNKSKSKLVEVIVPTEPSQSGQFNIKGDSELIAKGTHFWCSGHLSAVSIELQSPTKPDFCRDCYTSY